MKKSEHKLLEEKLTSAVKKILTNNNGVQTVKIGKNIKKSIT